MAMNDKAQTIGSAAFPLMMADAGARVRVVSLRGGASLDKRMMEMGIHVGAELLLQQREGGQIVVKRNETRFALGGGIAQRIFVQPV